MKNINKFETTERPECNKDTKLFFDDMCTNSTQTKKTQVKTAQCGRSMIEMLGVLAIVGVLSVGGIAGYSKAMQKFKINKTIDDISHIVTNIRTLYAQQTTYAGLNNETAIQMGVMPSGVDTYGDFVFNEMPGSSHDFGDVFYIWGNKYDGYGYNKYFSVSYKGLPKEVCVTLATYDWGDRYSSGLIGMSVSDNAASFNDFFNGYNIKPKGCSSGSNGYGNATTCIGSVMTVADAAQACQCEPGDGYDNGCEITWLYE